MKKSFIDEASESIKTITDFSPDIALVLGSGLGEMAEEIQAVKVIPYDKIPHFRTSTVAGHKGNLVLGTLCNKKVAAMQGRLHYYEGYSMFDITFPLRVINALGASKLIVTNAAGGINRNFNVGDLMLITDHINWSGMNPLLGISGEFGKRFVDMTFTYNRDLQALAKTAAAKNNIELREGVYAFGSGPTYETPSEVRMLEKLGADACGMSTVPEAVVARQTGMEILGISCITNMAAGILDQALSHQEVIETTERVKESFKKLVKAVLEEM